MRRKVHGTRIVVRNGDGAVFAQVPLLKSQLEELKRRSGTTTTKDALQAAVDHYLHCSEVQRRRLRTR